MNILGLILLCIGILTPGMAVCYQTQNTQPVYAEKKYSKKHDYKQVSKSTYYYDDVECQDCERRCDGDVCKRIVRHELGDMTNTEY